MRFKSASQRRAVFANMNFSQLRNKGVKIMPYVDNDHDGVVNKHDCKPLDSNRQGFLHEWEMKHLKVKEQKLENKRKKEQGKLDETLEELRAKQKVFSKKEGIKSAQLAKKQAVIDEVQREKNKLQELRQARKEAQKAQFKISRVGRATEYVKGKYAQARHGYEVGRAAKRAYYASAEGRAKLKSRAEARARASKGAMRIGKKIVKSLGW